jgi:two-component system, response regulator PdtaR
MEHIRQFDADRVLVVEDEALVRDLIIDMLDDAGFATIAACCAQEALQQLQSGPGIAAIVTDVDMPGEFDGIGLATRVSERWPWIGIIVTSGAHRGAALGLRRPALFLPKPFRADRLVAAVRSLIKPDFVEAERRAS